MMNNVINTRTQSLDFIYFVECLTEHLTQQGFRWNAVYERWYFVLLQVKFQASFKG
jgi:hypothetical protein